jgi:hypothetical protein
MPRRVVAGMQEEAERLRMPVEQEQTKLLAPA